MRITGIDKPTSSIFSRLGNKHPVVTNKNNIILTNKPGILKTSPKVF